MPKEDRGFASMDRNKQREIASKGGRTAHLRGTAHKWTREEAREAGRKGGIASHRKAHHESRMAAPATPESDCGVDTVTNHSDWPGMGSE